MGIRKTLVELAAPALLGGKQMAVNMQAVKSAGDIAFKVSVRDAANPDTQYEVADNAGKVRVFRDADDFMKQAGALSLVPSMMEVMFYGLELVAPKEFTGDIIKKAQSTVASYTKLKADADARSAKLATEIALMAADPTVTQARKDEVQAQKTAVDGLSAFYAAEIVRINAIISG